MSDNVNHPKHYNGNGLEPIEVIEKWNLGFCLGNTIKYIARAGKKNFSREGTIEDLEKAIWYLNRYIDNLKIETLKDERPAVQKCCCDYEEIVRK